MYTKAKNKLVRRIIERQNSTPKATPKINVYIPFEQEKVVFGPMVRATEIKIDHIIKSRKPDTFAPSHIF